MGTQLRRYTIRRGEGARFAKEWSQSVVPLRAEFGFRAHGWLVEGGDEFVWILEHDGDRAAFGAADKAYYASPQRRSLEPDPARLVADSSHDWVTTVL
jgi:hypothetical protein